jgi:hypothetical protein
MESAPGRAWDGRAGLVRLLQQQGRLDDALDAAAPLVSHLVSQAGRDDRDHGLGLCEQPLRVHLSVALPLMAARDARAEVIVKLASTLLARWVDSFDDPVRRQQLLQIPYHAEIVQISGDISAG